LNIHLVGPKRVKRLILVRSGKSDRDGEGIWMLPIK